MRLQKDIDAASSERISSSRRSGEEFPLEFPFAMRNLSQLHRHKVLRVPVALWISVAPRKIAGGVHHVEE